MASTAADLVHVRRTRVLPHDPAAIWAVLARFDGIGDWAAKVTHSALTTEQSEGVGTARRVQVGRQALIETVTVWEPESALEYAIEGLPPLVAGVSNRWDLTPEGSGTSVVLSSIIDPGDGVKGKIGSTVLKVPLSKASDSMLDGLTAHLARAKR